MTIGDYPEYLAIGHLLASAYVAPLDHVVTDVDYDEELSVVVVGQCESEDQL